VRLVGLRFTKVSDVGFHAMLPLEQSDITRERLQKLATVVDALRHENRSIMRGHDLWLSQYKHAPRQTLPKPRLVTDPTDSVTNRVLRERPGTGPQILTRHSARLAVPALNVKSCLSFRNSTLTIPAIIVVAVTHDMLPLSSPIQIYTLSNTFPSSRPAAINGHCMHKSLQRRFLPTVIFGLLLCVAGLLWPEPEYRRPLTLGVNIWPGAERLVQACDANNSNGLRINLVEMPWSTAVMGAFRKHVVDAAVVTLDEMIRLEADGAKPRAVLLLGISQGADAVLGHAGTNSMQSLRGGHIGVELRSAGEYLLHRALAANGMVLTDVQLVSVNLAETEIAYGEKSIDAVVCADPWSLRLQDKGATVLYDSRPLGLELSRVLVVREDALPIYARELRSLIATCLQVRPSANPPEAANELAATLRREGLKPAEWQQALQRIRLPDAAENRRLMTQAHGGLTDCLEQMIRTLREQGAFQGEISARTLLRPEFLEEAP
jgi:ABC-type nitrate/sulfonate/bicarbonate transport system substrate-binding protein